MENEIKDDDSLSRESIGVEKQEKVFKMPFAKLEGSSKFPPMSKTF